MRAVTQVAIASGHAPGGCCGSSGGNGIGIGHDKLQAVCWVCWQAVCGVLHAAAQGDAWAADVDRLMWTA